MAKKVINVVYKVDDSALSKTKVTIQQVAAETKKTEQAMQAAGNAAKKAGDQAKDTYTIQKVQLENLRAKIDQTSQSDTARMNKLKSEYLVLKKSVDDFNKSLQESKPAADSAATSFLSLDKIIKAAFSVAAVKQVISMTLEMAKLSGEVKGVETGFKRAFGATSSVLLESLKRSTHGVVTEFELMKQAVQAKNLGIPVEHLGVLLEFAATRAQQTGQSVDYLVDSIQKGIGRKSILFFDQLGISTTRLKEEMGGVAIKSQEVGDVSAAVARVAGEELKKMGGYVETSATKVDQLSVSWNKLKQTAANTVTSPGLLRFYDSFIKSLTQVVQSQADREAELKAGAAASVEKFLDGAKKTNQAIQDEIYQRVKNITALNDEKKAIEEQAKVMDDSMASGVDVTKQTEEKIMVEQEFIRLLYAQLEVQTKEIKGEIVQIGIIQQLKDQIEALAEEKDNATNPQRIIDINKETDSLKFQLQAVENLRGNGKAQTGSDVIAATGFDPENVKVELTSLKRFIELFQVDGYAETLRIRKETKDRDKKDKEQDEKDEKAHADRIMSIKRAVFEFGVDTLQQTLYATLINRDQDNENLNEYYDKQIEAAGDNEKLKKQIRERQAVAEAQARQRAIQADQDAAITKIAIDTAINVIRSIVNGGGIPAGLPFGALAAAAGLVQIATVKSVRSSSLQTRAFKDGEVDIQGPGTTTSDSINAKISRGESVINAEATAGSKNLLEAINDRKIDDRILYKIAGDGGRQANFDDRGIISAIERNKVDYFNQGYSLMKHEQISKNYKKIHRAKIHGR